MQPVVESGLVRLQVLDIASGKETARIPVSSLPRYAAVTPDGSMGLVVCSNPVGDARKGSRACVIALADLKTYDEGTSHDLDRCADSDNPTCAEMWRSGPYLHDGSAATLTEMLTTHNPQDRHGVTSGLSREDVDALVECVLSL